jgi:myo-inositol catabolism protein IolC
MEGASPDRIGVFKQLCLEATLKVQDHRPGYGILCDGRLGADALSAAEGHGLWIGRPVEWPGARPLTLEPALGPDYGGLSEWPRDQVVKVLCFCHPDDDDDMWSAQEAVVQRLFHAAPRNRLEFLLEVIPSKVGLVEDGTTARIIQRFCDLGVYPGWLKLEPVKTEAAWRKSVEAIERSDPRARGIVVLGLDAPEDELAASFVLAAKFPLVKGFAVGRTIFGDVARAWMRARTVTLTQLRRWRSASTGFAESGTKRGQPRRRQWHDDDHQTYGGPGHDALAFDSDDRGWRALHRRRLGDSSATAATSSCTVRRAGNGAWMEPRQHQGLQRTGA